MLLNVLLNKNDTKYCHTVYAPPVNKREVSSNGCLMLGQVFDAGPKLSHHCINGRYAALIIDVHGEIILVVSSGYLKLDIYDDFVCIFYIFMVRKKTYYNLIIYYIIIF